MTTRPFFYICVGLTLSLPLFYLDLAVVEFFEKGRRDSVSFNNVVVSGDPTGGSDLDMVSGNLTCV